MRASHKRRLIAGTTIVIMTMATYSGKNLTITADISPQEDHFLAEIPPGSLVCLEENRRTLKYLFVTKPLRMGTTALEKGPKNTQRNKYKVRTDFWIQNSRLFPDSRLSNR